VNGPGLRETGEVRALFSDREGDPLPIVSSIFTPYQLLLFERIMALVPDRPLLLIDSRPARYRDGRKPAIPPEQVRSLDLTGKVIDAEQARLVRQGLDEVSRFVGRKPFVFLCASYQRQFNTVLFTRYRTTGQARFLMMDDGLSTFLDPKSTRGEHVKNIGREIASRLRGYPKRRIFGGHPQGLDLPELSGILLSLDARPPGKEHRPYVVLPTGASSLDAGDPKQVLFVGQPYSIAYSWEVLDPLIRAIASDLRARGFERIAFKPHHFQPQEEVDRYLSQGFELIDPPIPVEEMIAGSQFRTIASINTTALLTTRALFGEAIHAIAYNPASFKPAQEQRDIREVEALFRRAGVEIVDCLSPARNGAEARLA